MVSLRWLAQLVIVLSSGKIVLSHSLQITFLGYDIVINHAMRVRSLRAATPHSLPNCVAHEHSLQKSDGLDEPCYSFVYGSCERIDTSSSSFM